MRKRRWEPLGAEAGTGTEATVVAQNMQGGVTRSQPRLPCSVYQAFGAVVGAHLRYLLFLL